jgi:4-hydroxybenzoate polyprenyltransferase
LKTSWDAFVYSGCILALGASGMAFAATIFYGVGVQNLTLLLVCLLVTFASYNINRFTDFSTEDVVNHPLRTQFVANFRPLAVLSVIAYGFALILTYPYGLRALGLIIAPPVVVSLYSIKWMPDLIHALTGFRRLKDIPLLKSLTASASWGLIAFLTADFVGVNYTYSVWAMFLFILLRFFVNTVSFDMRDVVGDALHKVNTIPILVGRHGTRNLLLGVNWASIILLLLCYFQGWFPLSSLLLISMGFYAHWFVIRATEMKGDIHFLCDVVIDGEFFLWAVILFVFRHFFKIF